MSEAQPNSGPPEALFKLANPIVKGILSSPLQGLFDSSLMSITYQGRKTGKSYTIPVGYHPQPDGTILAFSSHTCWKNLQGGNPVTLRLKGRDMQAFAEPVTSRDQVMPKVEAFIAENGIENARRLGLRVATDSPTPDELAKAAGNTVYIRLIPQSG